MRSFEMLKEYLRGTGVRRAIASVLVAAECLSVVSVGLPAAYAEEAVPLAAVEPADRTTNTAPAVEVPESGQEETVTPAEAARLGEEAATSFADEAERAAEGSDAGGHLLLGIHMDAVRAVADGPAEAEDADAFDADHFSLGAQAAFGRLAVVPVVVVAVDINDRRVGEAGDKGQVFRGKVARGKDHVHSLERRAAAFSPEPGRRFIGNGHNPHRGKLTFCSS